MGIPFTRELHVLRAALERTGLYRHEAVKEVFGRLADLQPTEAAEQASEAWVLPEPVETRKGVPDRSPGYKPLRAEGSSASMPPSRPLFWRRAFPW